MELLDTPKFYILNKGEDSLWFDKKSGSFTSKTCWDLASAGNPKCLGTVHGLLGKLQIVSDGPVRLGLITSVKSVGTLYSQSQHADSTVYCIQKVFFLPITSPIDIGLTLNPCPKHHTQHPNSLPHDKNSSPFTGLPQKVGLAKTFGTIKNVTSSIKNVTVNAAASATGQNKGQKLSREKEKYEKRILDEINKMFNESNSFYFCHEYDITNSIQKQNMPSYNTDLPRWKKANDKFFWNKFMLSEFIESQVPNSWLVPVIQGFVQIECITQHLPADNNQTDNPKLEQNAESDLPKCNLILISRRSRHRAGTRYKRRGVDEDGHVANYVETEQIIQFSDHTVSFVLVRGSVPLFWSQPGFKYRPPPRLDKSNEECSVAFKKHFDNELNEYENVICVNLVNANGKEKVLADAYLEHIFSQNIDKVSFIAFDFHEFCRGMRYENVCVLIEGIEPMISKMSYCWVDKEGLICQQNGVFRINCVDCLDRTNVVQTALGRCSLENQFAKLGVIAPQQQLPEIYKTILQIMWANNGDTLSKQYAGTSALKGDFTRTGERKFSGLMKDGMNSANRYYMNRFKDAYRQATIDTMLGGHVTEDFTSLTGDVAEEEDSFVAQRVKHIIDDCKKFLVADVETIVGAWGLIDADPTSGDLEQIDMDLILILTRDSYYAAEYDEAADRISRFDRVSLIDLDGIEIGPYAFQGVFKQTKTLYCIRLLYQVEGQSGYFHMFRPMNIRFFNNMAVTIKTEEEIIESIKSIGDNFEMASQMIGCNVSILTGKLERKRSRGKQTSNPLHLLNPIASFTKRSPDSFMNVGTRAFNNMTSGLAKLNPINLARKTSSKEGSKCLEQHPVVSITEPLTTKYFVPDICLESCGIIAHGSDSTVGIDYESRTESRGQSLPLLPNISRNGSATPEIKVSHEASLDVAEKFSLTTRIRHLSRSSNEIDPRESEENVLFQKASSTSGLDLELEAGRLGDKKSFSGDIFSRLPLSPLSPLANLNKETVLAPFSVLARGVQSLAPNAGKLAKGMQNLGALQDPRKLKIDRQLELEKNIDLKKRILQCKSAVLLF